MLLRAILFVAFCAPLVAQPVLAQDGSGNVDPWVGGPSGSTGQNDVGVVTGSVPGAAAAPAYSAGANANTAQMAPAQAPAQAAPMHSFNARGYSNVSECLTAAYAANQPLAQCER